MSDIEPGAHPLTAGTAGTLIERLGIELLAASPTTCVATMPVTGNTQPLGLLHGGGSAALAETVASVAAALHAGDGRTAVGLELSITHHRAVRSGIVTARAKAVHLGRTTATYLVEIVDGEDRLISSARLTCLLLPSSGAASATSVAPTAPEAPSAS